MWKIAIAGTDGWNLSDPDEREAPSQHRPCYREIRPRSENCDEEESSHRGDTYRDVMPAYVQRITYDRVEMAIGAHGNDHLLSAKDQMHEEPDGCQTACSAKKNLVKHYIAFLLSRRSSFDRAGATDLLLQQ